jgi:hypothetical protein
MIAPVIRQLLSWNRSAKLIFGAADVFFYIYKFAHQMLHISKVLSHKISDFNYKIIQCYENYYGSVNKLGQALSRIYDDDPVIIAAFISQKGEEDGGEVVSLTRRPPFTSRKIPGTHFC